MRINYFKAKKIHGYLDFNLKLNSDISFLTGINGAGKTTVVNLIVSLISPSFEKLIQTKFQEIELGLGYLNEEIRFVVKRDNEFVILKLNNMRMI